MTLVLGLCAAGCSAILEFKDYNDTDCGNGVQDPDEECDDGPDNSDSVSGACRMDCRLPHCGDSVTDSDMGELCDSGADNGQPGRCNDECDGYVPDGDCGNGEQDPGEECDDGLDLNGSYGHCAADCGGPGPHCGDDIRDADHEACDAYDLGPVSCSDLAPYTGGDLGCDPQCRYDVSTCATPAECAPLPEPLMCNGGFSGSTTMPGSTNNMVDHCGFTGSLHSGRELVYRFSSPDREWVNVELSGLTADLDIIVMVDADGSCAPDLCVAAGMHESIESESVGFVAEAGLEYLILIDGYDGAVSGFDLELTCGPDEDCTNNVDDNNNGLIDCADPFCFGDVACPGESDCADLQDNDSDGQADCADSDCFGVTACVCVPTASITGCVSFGADSTVGETDYISSGWCSGGSAPNHTGPEKLYTWIAQGPLPSAVFVSLTNLTVDLDLFVLELHSGDVCGPEHCIASSMTGGAVDEFVVFSPVAGSTYIFVVDGWMGAEGSYYLDVTCN